MTTATATLASEARESEIRDYVSLLKPGVMMLVVFTGAIGMLMAPGTLHPFLQILTVLCIALGSGAGAAINMWYDRDIDAVMQRTSKRSLPSGRVQPEDVLALGLILAFGSVMMLGLAVGWAAAGLLAFAIWFYAHFYTMVLKRATPHNIVIGGAAGAFPAAIGWLAVSQEFAWDPILYFLIVFLWTPPHFWALAIHRHDDYKTAGVPMLPVSAGQDATKNQILAYSIVLCAASLLPSLVGQSGIIYLIGASLLGLEFLRRSIVMWRHTTSKHCMALFGYSILYLFLLFSLLLIDKLVDNHLF